MNEFSPQARIDFENLSIVKERDDKFFLIDGSVLTEVDDDFYTLAYPNGQKAEYYRPYNEDDLFLKKETTPAGKMVLYDYAEDYNGDDETTYTQVKIYERDEDGHYVYHKYEKDDDEIGALLETIEGNVNDSHSLKTQIDIEDLPVIEDNDDEKILADGSVLKEEDDDFYTLTYPNGQTAEYRCLDDSYYSDKTELHLTKEETPDGRLVIYDYKEDYDEDEGETTYTQVKKYERDASGNYVYYRYDREDDKIGDLIEKIEGNVNDNHVLKPIINFDEIIEDRGSNKILVDGSVLKEEDDDFYTLKYPNGKTAEYHCLDNDDYSDNRELLFLTKEETTDGSLNLYGYKEDYDKGKDEIIYNQVKVYERDADGNYTFNRYEKDNGLVTDLLETIEGNVNDKHVLKAQIKLDAFPVIEEKDDERILADGSVLEEEDDDLYTLKYPDGYTAEYSCLNDDYYSDDKELFLTKEETPDGRLVLYGYKEDYNEDEDETTYTQVKIYERDAKGNYIFNRYEKNDGFVGDLIETIEGNINDKKDPVERIELAKLAVIEEKDDDKFLADGSILKEEQVDFYTMKYPDGRTAEYNCFENYYSDDKELYLTKEETPDGRQVVYDYKENYDEEKNISTYSQVKIYEQSADGYYVRHKYDDDDGTIGKLIETTEGKGDKWTRKTFYDDDEKPWYYQLDGDETKKYYPSGKLMEEQKGDIVSGYYETGALKSEKHPNGEIKEYAPNGLLLYEEDEFGNYKKFKLNQNETGTLLLEKGRDNRFKERYVYDTNDDLLQKEVRTPKGMLTQIYYPDSDQKIKEEKRPDGSRTIWSRNGRDYQKFDDRGNLIEDCNVFGRTVYTYYLGTNKPKHIHKYNESNVEITGAYRHFDKEGNDNTQYYLARKKIIERRLKKEDERAEKKGIDRVQAIRKKRFRKLTKAFEHLKAMREINSQ